MLVLAPQRTKFTWLCAVCFVLALAGCEPSAMTEDVFQDVVIEDAHMRPPPPGQTNAAIYLNLVNKTDRAQTLSYLHTEYAEVVEVHRNYYESGMMRMRQIDHLRVPAGEALRFKPGGYHLMIIGIYEPFDDGDSFPLVIEFDTGLKVETTVAVRR